MAPPGKKKKKKKSKEPAQPAWDLELDEAELEQWKQLLTQPQKIFLVQCTPTIPARAHAARPAPYHTRCTHPLSHHFLSPHTQQHRFLTRWRNKTLDTVKAQLLGGWENWQKYVQGKADLHKSSPEHSTFTRPPPVIEHKRADKVYPRPHTNQPPT